MVLGAVLDEKVLFAASVPQSLRGRGLHAGNLLKEVAKVAGGGGGGRAEFAQAGGRFPDKLEEALAAVPDLLQAQLKA